VRVRVPFMSTETPYASPNDGYALALQSGRSVLVVQRENIVGQRKVTWPSEGDFARYRKRDLNPYDRPSCNRRSVSRDPPARSRAATQKRPNVTTKSIRTRPDSNSSSSGRFSHNVIAPDDLTAACRCSACGLAIPWSGAAEPFEVPHTLSRGAKLQTCSITVALPIEQQVTASRPCSTGVLNCGADAPRRSTVTFKRGPLILN